MRILLQQHLTSHAVYERSGGPPKRTASKRPCNIIPGYSVVVTPPACLSFYIRTYQYSPPHPRLSKQNSLAAPMLIKSRCSRNPASGLAEASTFPVRLLSRSAGFRWRTRQRFSTGGAGGLSGIGFVYGIPIALIGLALKVRYYRVRSTITVLLTDSSMIHIWYTSFYGYSDTAVREVRLLLHCCTYVYSYIIRKCCTYQLVVRLLQQFIQQ